MFVAPKAVMLGVGSRDKLPPLVESFQGCVSDNLSQPSPTTGLLTVELFQPAGEGAKAGRWCLKTSCFG